jgi:TonB-linked SusC/RagA family outer membrane protein
MKQKKILYSFVLIIMGTLTMFSQTKTIKGIVVDATGEALSGVNITIKGTTKETSTGFDGSFEIKSPEEATFIFSYLGFTSREVKASSSPMRVMLNQSNQNLKEVVVTGSLGISRKKRELAYATQTIEGKQIAETQRSNFINSLQGRVAGLTVTSTSGAPGSSSAIQLRGVNSISGNNSPLYVVDGLPISNQTLNQGLLISDQPNRQQDFTNRGADINPEDIESVTILKGPEAAALYGIEAGNGAIIITTKKGKKGLGSINYSSNIKVENLYRFPENQKVYQRGINGLDQTIGFQAFGTKYPEGTKTYDNVGNFFKTGITRNNNISFDGGNETFTYRLGFANLDQTGVVPNTAYTRLNTTLNGSAKISNTIKSDASFLYSRSTNKKASKGAGGFLLNTLAWPINDDARNYLQADGLSRRRITDNSVANEIDNPFWDINKNLAQDKNDRMVANLGITYDPAEWITLVGRVGYDINAGNGYRAIHPDSNLGLSLGGYLENYYNKVSNTNTNFFATLRKSVGKFSGKLIAGNAINDTRQSILSTQGNKFVEKDFVSINNVDQLTMRSQERLIRKKVVGFYGEATLTYDKMATLTFSGRKDWSSTLPKGNNDFFYPSIGGSFVFSEIGSLKDSEILTLGKLRASYAQVANDASPYDIVPSYQPQLSTGGGFAYGVTGANSDLKPEVRKSTELGAEFQLFKNRLGIDVAVYRSKTEDPIIRNLRLSYGTGFVVSSYNYGALQNEGLEITINAKPIETENFHWSTNINFTKTDSKLLSLPPTLPEYYNSDTWLYGNVRAGSRVGGPLTTFTGGTYTYNNKGQVLIDPSTGYPIYNNTFPIIGDRNPDFVIGLQNSFTYKNLTLSFLLDIRKGGDVFNGNEMYLWSNGFSERSLDREKPVIIKGVLRDGLQDSANPTPNNVQITPYYQNGYYANYVESDFIEKDINWLRMRDITLTYNLSSSNLKNLRLFKSMSFNLTVTDAFMITNYTGADPAVNGLNASVGGAGGAGFDYGVISTPRGVNFGIRVGL